MTEVSTQADEHRRLLPDLIRAWAIIGIVLVNVQVFSYSFMDGYSAGGMRGPVDEIATFLVLSLFMFKSYSLFSLMFGAGLAFQMQAAERAGKAFTPRFMRRLLGLLILGILHVVFLFVGDILVTYAVLGVILYFCRNGKPRDLWIWGIILLVFQTLLLLGAGGALLAMKMGSPEAFESEMAKSLEMTDVLSEAFTAAYTGGNFFEVAQARIGLLPLIYQGIPMTQGFSAFGFFLIGLALVKTGSISDVKAKIWAWGRWVGLPVGLIGSAYGTHLYLQADGHTSPIAILASGILLAASPFSTFGYGGWIAKIAEVGKGPVIRFLARGGGATLTAYLLQSIILSTVFAGYGLGLFGQVSAATTIVIALATGVFTLVFSSLWRKKFDRGPFEMVLRRFTYWGRN